MKFLRYLLVTLMLSVIANAQLASLQIDSVSPPGAQSGTTLEISLSGQDLDELKRLMFTHPGITGKHIDGNRFEVTIGADVPSDYYEVRVAGRFGLSNSRPFEVSALPQMNETGTHQTAETAMPLPFNTIVNGTADADAADVYKFTAGADQRVFIECVADRLDSRMDATLVVTDASGAELVRDRDSYGRDPFIDFTAPIPGDYFVAVHDFQFKGSGNHCYRLTLNTGAHIDYIMPASGTPGKRERFTIFGRNIPGGQRVPGLRIKGRQLEQKEVEIDVPAEPNRLMSRAIAAAGTAGTAVHLQETHRLTDLALAQAPVVLEREPNNRSTNAQRVSIPCEIGGQFFPANDSDWFEFDGRKDQTYWIEVFSERHGDATDPFLVVQKVTRDGEGKEVENTVVEGDDIDEKAGAHIFPGKSRDARVTFKADADARYRILVRDQFSGVDPRHTYRLVIREPQPDFTLIAGAQQRTDEGDQMSRATAYLLRDGSRRMKIMAHRRDGFNGPIDVTVEALPVGVIAQPCTIPAGQRDATLTLTASADAPDFAGSINIKGHTDIGGKKVTRSASGVSLLWGVGNWKQEFTRARLSSQVTLAVSGVEPAPVALKPAEDKTYETSLAGTLEIPLQLARRDNIKDKATIQPVGLPGLKKPRNSQIDNNAKDTKLVLDLTKKDGNEFKPGEYTIFAQTKGTMQYRANPEAQQRADTVKKEKDAVVSTIEREHKAAEEAHTAISEEIAKLNEQIAGQALTADEGARLMAEKQKSLELTIATRDSAAKKLETARKEQVGAEAKLKAATDRAKPQDKKFHTLSQPIRIRIAPAPVKLPDIPQQTMKPESKMELPINVERLFGFAEVVDLSVDVPEQAKGIQVQPASIAKDSTEARLVITSASEASPGDKELKLNARVKWNGEELVVTRVLKVCIAL